MKKALLYEVKITLGREDTWTRFFIGRPTKEEVICRLNERLRHELIIPPQLTCNVNIVYDHMVEMVSEFGLPTKAQGLRCDYLGTCVGNIAVSLLSLATLSEDGKTVLNRDDCPSEKP
jgi:hypothetical protein